MVKKGFSVGVKLQVPELAPFLLSTNADTAPTASPTTGSQSDSPPPLADNAQQRKANIHKNFGPVSLQSVNMHFANGGIEFEFDAGFKLGPLVLSFEGFELGSSLSHFSPTASLTGLGLEYHANDLEIEGVFNHQNSQYLGEFVYSMPLQQISVMGIYEDKDEPSIFLYGALCKPMGGPPFCFVEGVAVVYPEVCNLFL